MTAPPARVLVTGAGGAGTTTLASSLAGGWSVPHADADDYYWVPTDPPYRSKRDPAARVALTEQVFLPRPTGYDAPQLEGRSLHQHLAWIDQVDAPALRLDAGRPVEEYVDADASFVAAEAS